MRVSNSQKTTVTKGQILCAAVCEVLLLLDAALQFLNMLSVDLWKQKETGSFIFVLHRLVEDVADIAERHGQLFKMLGGLMLLGIALLVFSVLQMNLPLLRGTGFRKYNVRWPLYSVLYVLFWQAATLAVFFYRKGTVTFHFGFWCCVGCEVLTLLVVLVVMFGHLIVKKNVADDDSKAA